MQTYIIEIKGTTQITAKDYQEALEMAEELGRGQDLERNFSWDSIDVARV